MNSNRLNIYFSHIRAILKKKWQPSFLGSDISCEVHWQVSSSSLRRQTEYSLRASLEAARWFRCQCLWFHVQRLPCATGLVKGLDCVSVLLEPPPGCPVPLPRPTGDPFSSQTHWPILLPFFCLPLSLRLLPSPAAAKLFISGSPLKGGETGALNLKTSLKFLFWLWICPRYLSLLIGF